MQLAQDTLTMRLRFRMRELLIFQILTKSDDLFFERAADILEPEVASPEVNESNKKFCEFAIGFLKLSTQHPLTFASESDPFDEAHEHGAGFADPTLILGRLALGSA